MEPWWWAWVELSANVLALLSVPSVLLERRGRSTAALSWLFFLALWPLGGVVAWWLIGRTHLERKRRRRRQARSHLDAHLCSVWGEEEASEGETTAPEPAERSALPWRCLPSVCDTGVFRASRGNRVELFVDGGLAFERFEEAFRSARHHIHLLFYIWELDQTGERLLKLLCERARAGLEVRLLIDPIGSPALDKRARALRAAGLQVEAFLPPRLLSWRPVVNFRNHRKLIVVDGAWGYLGGMNVGEPYRRAWHDMGVGLRGRAVRQLQEIFAEDWYFATGEDLVEGPYFDPEAAARAPIAATLTGADEVRDAVCHVLPSGPDLPLHTIHDALITAIEQARSKAWLCTPYLVPTSAMSAALRVAVLRGVDVRLLVPAKNDVALVALASRSFYPELLRAGVRIFEYEPRVLHAKAAVFDEERSFLGSANMDIRSFRLNFELGCFIASRELARRLAAQFERDFGMSREVELEAIEKQPLFKQVLEASAHLLSPLL